MRRSLSASVEHPNVVRIYDVGEDQGKHFIALEFLPENLARVIHSGNLPIVRAATLGAQMADGLAAVHALGVVHRDIKPQNVLITPEGVPKVTDFGIARSEALSRMTATGVMMGTPYYMSPEQARGETATPRSDVYSLGCVLYQMLTGDVPFKADTPLAVLRRHIEDPHEAVRRIRRDVPSVISDIVDKAMAKDPESRYADGAEMASAIRAAVPGIPASEASVESITPPTAETAPAPAPKGVGERARRFSGRVIGFAITAGAIATIAVVAAVVAVNRNEPAPGDLEQVGATATPTPAATSEPEAVGSSPVPTATTAPVLAPMPTPTAEATSEPVPQPTATPVFTPSPVPGPRAEATIALPAPTATPVPPARPEATATSAPATPIPAIREPVSTIGPNVSTEGLEWVERRDISFDPLHSVASSGDTILLGGVDGLIYRSADGGETWMAAETAAFCDILALQYVSGDVAFGLDACGGEVLRTDLDGRSWHLVAERALGDVDGRDLFFLDSQQGWITGDSGTVASTRDGGRTWVFLDVPTQSSLNTIAFADSDRGWVGGDNRIFLQTIDGGASWQRPDTPSVCGGIFDIEISGLAIWVVTDCGQVLLSTDGGESWDDRSIAGDDAALFGVSALDGRSAWAAGVDWELNTPIVVETHDGGATWTGVFSGDGGEGTFMAAGVFETSDGLTGVAVGDAGLFTQLVTADRAKQIRNTVGAPYAPPDIAAAPSRGELPPVLSWERQFEFTFDTLQDVAIVDRDHVYAASRTEAVYFSPDGGREWIRRITPTFCEIRRLQHLPELGVLALDNCGGAIYVTRDDGDTWKQISPDSLIDSSADSFFFLDGDHGWVGGYPGALARTLDGGLSWERVDIATGRSVDSLYFIDELHGFSAVAGVLATEDGGVSWKRLPVPTICNDILDLDVRWPLIWAVGGCGEVFFSPDGGVSWEDWSVATGVTFNSVSGWDGQVAWAAGFDFDRFAPVLYETRDGGATWHEALRADDLANGEFEIAVEVVETVDGVVGWLVGDGGLVARLVSGESFN